MLAVANPSSCSRVLSNGRTVTAVALERGATGAKVAEGQKEVPSSTLAGLDGGLAFRLVGRVRSWNATAIATGKRRMRAWQGRGHCGPCRVILDEPWSEQNSPETREDVQSEDRALMSCQYIQGVARVQEGVLPFDREVPCRCVR